jgi:hypothetical protein
MPTPTMLVLPNTQAHFAAITTGRVSARPAPADGAETRPDPPGGFETFLAAALPRPVEAPIARPQSETAVPPPPTEATPVTRTIPPDVRSPIFVVPGPVPTSLTDPNGQIEQQDTGKSWTGDDRGRGQSIGKPKGDDPTPMPQPVLASARLPEVAELLVAPPHEPAVPAETADKPIRIDTPPPAEQPVPQPEAVPPAEAPGPKALKPEPPPSDSNPPATLTKPDEPRAPTAVRSRHRIAVSSPAERKTPRPKPVSPEPPPLPAHVEPLQAIPAPPVLPASAPELPIIVPDSEAPSPAPAPAVSASAPVAKPIAPAPAPPEPEQHRPASHTDQVSSPQLVSPEVAAAAPVRPRSPAPEPAAPLPPAEQLAPVLVSVSRDTANVRHMTLQLQPDALGHLQIQIERAPNQTIQIRVQVERPETLSLLQRDTPQLQHALDRAGVARDTMTVTFHWVPSVAGVPTAQDMGQPSMQFIGTGQPHQGFGSGRPPPAPFLQVDAGETAALQSKDPVQSRTVRSGIDIVA